MSAEIFSNIYNGPFKRYLLLSKTIGQDVQNHSEIADCAFQAELRYLEFSENFKKPVMEQVILSPIEDQIDKAVHYVCIDPIMGDHINVIVQSIKALLWIKQQDPVGYLEEIVADTKAYTDVLLVFFKDREPHTEWVDAWLETLNDLNNFVRRRYPKGLTWKGEHEAPESSLLGDVQDSHAALFDEINKGETIHQVLRRANSQSEEEAEENTTKKDIPNENEIFIQDGKKWRIEHKKGGHKHLTIDKADSDNVLYIYDCSNVTIVVERKINVIKLDSCEKICVIFRSLISGIEMIGSKIVKLHAFGALPSVNIDTCSDVNIHLTRKGRDAQVITSQSSKISLSYPLEDGYYKTFYIPSRLMTTINVDNSLKSYPLLDE